MSGENTLPTCYSCHAPARERRVLKITGEDYTLCPACDRRLGALVDWDNKQLLEDKATCPYCGYEDYDSWEYEEGHQVAECPSCGRKFELEVVVDVKYTSSRRSEDMPDDYMYMSDTERFEYGEKLMEVVE